MFDLLSHRMLARSRFSLSAAVAALGLQAAFVGLLLVLFPTTAPLLPLAVPSVHAVFVSPILLGTDLLLEPDAGQPATGGQSGLEIPQTVASLPPGFPTTQSTAPPGTSVQARSERIAPVPAGSSASVPPEGSASRVPASSGTAASTSPRVSPVTSSASSEPVASSTEVRAVALPTAVVPEPVVVARVPVATPAPTPVPRAAVVEQPKGEDRPPRPTRNVPAQYPPIARNQRISGTVLVRVTVSAEGTVEEVKVLESPSPLLDQASMEAARKMKFEPALVNGKPARGNVDVPFRFAFK